MKYEVIVLKKSVVINSTAFEELEQAQHHFATEVFAISEAAYHANEDAVEGTNALHVDGYSIILATY